MVSLLLIISFLLHIIALFAIFQLFKQLQSEKKQANAQEVMEIFEVYLDEIRQENNELKNLLMQDQTAEEETETEKIEMNKETTEKRQMQEDNQVSEQSGIDSLLDQSPGYQVGASLESRVLQLHSTGKSVEEIAKTLNCGKTEAELIIKLYQKA